MPTAKILQYNI